MRGTFFRRLTTVVLAFAFAQTLSFAGSSDLISTMRNVNAVGEHAGFRLNPAYDAAAPMTDNDLAPPQAFEIIRPGGRPVTLGRLYTSCTCVQLEAPKRTFGPDERAVLQLRNIKPTPLNGQVYAVYVQITSPIRTTLRFDTFVQTNSVVVPEDASEPVIDSVASPVVEPQVSSSAGIEIVVPSSGVDAVDPDDENGGPEGAVETATDEEDTSAAAGSLRPPSDAADAIDPAAVAQDQSGDTTEPAQGEGEDLPDLFTDLEGTETPGNDGKEDDIVSPIPEPAIPSVADGWDGTEEEPDVPAAPPAPETSVAPPAPAAAPEPTPEPPPAPQELTQTQDRDQAEEKPLQMISLITIGVRDMPRAVNFYEAVGWRRAARNKYDQTAFFQLNGQVLALYPLPDLLKEQNMGSANPAPGGITLAIHVDSKADVQNVYRSFVDAGGVSLKEPTEMPSGAVTCYVADPDGNPWEISWVPQFRVDQDGGLWLP